jgi:hypothetical protein
LSKSLCKNIFEYLDHDQNIPQKKKYIHTDVIVAISAFISEFFTVQKGVYLFFLIVLSPNYEVHSKHDII